MQLTQIEISDHFREHSNTNHNDHSREHSNTKNEQGKRKKERMG